MENIPAHSHTQGTSNTRRLSAACPYSNALAFRQADIIDGIKHDETTTNYTKQFNPRA